jgi:asparagine N-glycosylation enzyme membrane subunit Stt3
MVMPLHMMCATFGDHPSCEPLFFPFTMFTFQCSYAIALKELTQLLHLRPPPPPL